LSFDLPCDEVEESFFLAFDSSREEVEDSVPLWPTVAGAVFFAAWFFCFFAPLAACLAALAACLICLAAAFSAFLCSFSSCLVGGVWAPPG
jgi:hypothetical protein